MVDPVADAFRILGHFWLEEVRPDDIATIAALPGLGDALPGTGAAALDDLAVEYQRLFGLNLPPYESVFIDPSAMLFAPATTRVQALYRRGNWSPSADVRVGAPDHLGLELLALADGLASGQHEFARRLHAEHLALWVPPFIQALQRLAPQPFYARLGNLTLALLLETLPAASLPAFRDPFPVLPPPPVYQGNGMAPRPEEEPALDLRSGSQTSEVAEDPSAGSGQAFGSLRSRAPGDDLTDVRDLRTIVRRLLAPREAGLFLTRTDLVRLSRGLHLAGVMGERSRMLEMLFRLAGQYDLLPTLSDQLVRLFEQADATYCAWVEEYPHWSVYAGAWRHRLAATRASLAGLRSAVQG